jgi:RNA-directed DNA polymerase
MRKNSQDQHYAFVNNISDAWNFLKSHPKKNTKGVDGVSINSFLQNWKRNLKAIKLKLSNDTFKFQKMRPVDIGNREILICTVEDRIVSRALLMTIEPLFKGFNSNVDFSREVSYEKDGEILDLAGVPLATLVMQDNIKEGYCWIFETDIKKFFDNIPKDKLLGLISKEVKNPKLLKLIEEVIAFQVEKEQADSNKESKGYPVDKGVAQGSALSPLLASIYLFEFDSFIKEIPNVRLVRYVDDFVIQCKTEEDAKRAYPLVLKKLKDMGLDIHPLDTPDEKGKIKTRIVHCIQKPFDFLGLTFNGAVIDISKKKKGEFIQDIRTILYGPGDSFLEKMKKIERKLEGGVKQYNHSHYRTKASLEALIKNAGEDMGNYLSRQTRRILGRDVLYRLNETQRKRALRFFGLDFDKVSKSLK